MEGVTCERMIYDLKHINAERDSDLEAVFSVEIWSPDSVRLLRCNQIKLFQTDVTFVNDPSCR